jgi:hypothetical protein
MEMGKMEVGLREDIQRTLFCHSCFAMLWANLANTTFPWKTRATTKPVAVARRAGLPGTGTSPGLRDFCLRNRREAMAMRNLSLMLSFVALMLAIHCDSRFRSLFSIAIEVAYMKKASLLINTKSFPVLQPRSVCQIRFSLAKPVVFISDLTLSQAKKHQKLHRSASSNK